MGSAERRILILYISEFGGHSKAAKNIEEALLYKDASIQTLLVNGLGYFYPRGEKIVDFIYNIVIKHIPRLWGTFYDKKTVVKTLLPVRRIVNKIAFRKFKRIIKHFNPTCVVATQAFPCGVAADFKEKYNFNIPLIAVVTDYHPHRLWLHPYVDNYVVACNEAKRFIVNEGIQEDKINILGIPISVKFLNARSYHKTVHDVGLSLDLPSILIMGGGLGIGPIKQIVRKLDTLEVNFQVVVICGRNKKLYRWFTKNKNYFKKQVFYFGYIDFVHNLMNLADIIITKGGGITVSEALSSGLAIVITSPIPGQEEMNVNYLVKEGACIKANKIYDVREIVRILLEDENKLHDFRQKAKNNSISDSSLRIADLILSKINPVK